MRKLKIQIKRFILLFIILIIGFLFRFNNLNWDKNFHLHPDERFLTMVGNAMKLPKDINEYLDPKVSKLNPNNVGYNFFVYGTFPLILNKYLAFFTDKDNYNHFTILGRNLSAFIDFLVIILVYKTVQILFDFLSYRQNEVALKSPKGYREGLTKKIFSFIGNDRIALWSAFLYSIAVYSIQASHFFTTDTFLNFFMFASFYFSLRFYVFSNKRNYGQRKIFKFDWYLWNNIIWSAIFFSLALASKITAIFILPLLLYFIFKANLKRNIFKIGFFLIVSYIVLRFVNPYYFQNYNFFDPRLNQTFVNSIKELKSFEGKDVWYPPAVQWMNKPITFVLQNLMLVGVGIPFFILIVVGIVWTIYQRSKIMLIILYWVLGYLTYLSFQFVKSIRYTIFIYPFLAIFAGIGVCVILSRVGFTEASKKQANNLVIYFNKLHPLLGKFLVMLFLRMTNLIIIVFLLIWPLMFSSIYLHKNTRVEASEWIYKNLPNNSYILSEAWDDSLPLPIINNYSKQFFGEQLPIFDPDTPEKWQKINNALAKADYYILSSNRGWGSISTVPEKYPLMSKFYNNLFQSVCYSNKVRSLGESFCYKKIKEFNPYYYKFLKLPNHWVEETFTVYDHPTVLIFKNEKSK